MGTISRGALFGGARGDVVTFLQRAVGNRATSRLMAVSPASVQRHSSWEHALLGDTPAQLGRAAVPNGTRPHILAEEWSRMRFFEGNPFANPTERFPDVRWIQLQGSSLWVSNGELNALGDYLPDPTAYDTMTAEQLVPVLQRMRGGIMAMAGAEFNLHDDSMAGAADSSILPGAAGEVQSLDSATADLGTNRYKGLLARNACHFAPLSWERWSLHHNEAADDARAHHATTVALTPLAVVDTSTEMHERQALLKNGYADHFLQDSFAAGHLVNKTLVMQWFVDYLNGMNWLDRPWVGMPGPEVLKRLGSARQPGVAGMDHYDQPPDSERTSEQDQLLGNQQTDPQTAQERDTLKQRTDGSGVSGAGADREANYQAYLGFLNSAFLQMSAGAVHDYLNERGLIVFNQAGTKMRVGGDDTLLSQSDEIGAQTAAQAAADSRQAIDDLLLTGETAHSVDAIFALVPQFVRVSFLSGATETYGLADFQTEVVRGLCWSTLFPELVDSLKGLAVRIAGATMVDDGVSQDSGGLPSSPVGDFPVPTGGSSTA